LRLKLKRWLGKISAVTESENSINGKIIIPFMANILYGK
jgi:hypothetical protein